MLNLIKLKEYKDGLQIYFCLHCKHKISKPKNKDLKDYKCLYCGKGI